MNKIVELLIDWDEMDFSDTGVSIMSLVSEPAIGVEWQKFAAQKFVEVKPGESEDDYVSRCIPVLIGEGFDDDQAAAICYGSYDEMAECEDCFDLDEACWPGYEAIGMKTKNGKQVPNCVPIENKKQEMSEEHMDAIEAMLADNKFGRTFDLKTTTFVNMSKDYFADADEVIEGIGALNSLLDGGDDIETSYVYKYTQGGSSANRRRFCTIMMQANRYFSLQEINDMSSASVNGEFAEKGKSNYDIFKYHGGLYCKHYWTRFRVFKDARGRETVVEQGRAEGLAGVETNNQRNRGRMTFNKQQQFYFSDDDQQIVVAPAMIPNMLIPRKDADGNMFHVYFSQDTVKKIAAKFLEENNQNYTDVNHDDNVTTENTLLESWIVEDPDMDKSKSLGFNVPASTWMVSYKINDDETWKKIKDGYLNGFSVTGQFLESNTKY